jgi:hypothetical protein
VASFSTVGTASFSSGVDTAGDAHVTRGSARPGPFAPLLNPVPSPLLARAEIPRGATNHPHVGGYSKKEKGEPREHLYRSGERTSYQRRSQ